MKWQLKYNGDRPAGDKTEGAMTLARHRNFIALGWCAAALAILPRVTLALTPKAPVPSPSAAPIVRKY